MKKYFFILSAALTALLFTTAAYSQTVKTVTIKTGLKKQSGVPLVIVDGEKVSEADYASMNPSEVASITLLKDPASLSLYGIEGANGVVLITSKKATQPAQLKQNISQQAAARGESSTKPYVIVDGKAFEDDLSTLSPEKIETLTLLKGNSAVKEYGSDGLNGVIIITTKKETSTTGKP